MQQPERVARDAFRKCTVGRLNIKLIENLNSQGTPDSICINRNGAVFWIEFKALTVWPIRATTMPLRTKFEKGQIPFMKEWISWGGKAFALVKISDSFFLLHPKKNIELIEMNRADIEQFALAKGAAENIVKYLEDLT